MKISRLAANVLLIVVGAISTTRLLAACNEMQSYKMDIVYLAKNDTKLDATEEMYKNKSIEVLEKYLVIDPSYIPQNMKFEMEIRDRKSINEKLDKSLFLAKDDYEKGKISEKAYQKAVKGVEEERSETCDKIFCRFTDEKDTKSGNKYMCEFNGDTKEVLCVSGPRSNDYRPMDDDERRPQISEDKIGEIQVKYAKLIKDNKIGGIETPICVETEEDLFKMVFHDKNDALKEVVIFMNPEKERTFRIIIK